MTISQSKYVDIQSGINRTQLAREKELIARIFTNNSIMPIGVYEFDDIRQVEETFGGLSVEYVIAEKYFNYVNKYARKPQKISFARDFSGGMNSFVQSKEEANSLASLKTITDGLLTINIATAPSEASITSINLSSATSYNDVASLIQTAIRAYGTSESEELLEGAIVTQNDGKFRVELDGGIPFEFDETNLSTALKISKNDNIVSSRGADATSNYEDVLESSYQENSNFATFTFIDNEINSDSWFEIAKWGMNNHPSEFMCVIPVTFANKNEIQDKVKDVDGVSLELCEEVGNGRFNFIMPMAITATTDYNKENGTVNYMFNQYNQMEVMVDDDGSAEDCDNKKINYYGRTQQAGQKIAFYQNGVLQGGFQDQNIYVNEIWLKDALATVFLNYMLSTSNWYANKSGQSIGQGLITDVIDRAKLNGTITTEKEINVDDKVFIYNITSDENAWRQIYQEGYYLMTDIVKVTENNQIKYKFVYTLVYSKGDSIKKVEGYNILV